MRCVICNRVLGEKEIQLEGNPKKTEPCGECLDVIYEAAYPAGFDPLDDDYVLIEDRDETLDLRSVVPFFKSEKEEHYD